jgi:hypothetical protein
MGQAFSGPNAFKFLHLTPEATAVLQADPFLFAELIIVLTSCSLIILLAWYIHFVTNKVCPIFHLLVSYEEEIWGKGRVLSLSLTDTSRTGLQETQVGWSKIWK